MSDLTPRRLALQTAGYAVSVSIIELKEHLGIPHPSGDWTPQDDLILELADLIRAEQKLNEMAGG